MGLRFAEQGNRLSDKHVAPTVRNKPVCSAGDLRTAGVSVAPDPGAPLTPEPDATPEPGTASGAVGAGVGVAPEPSTTPTPMNGASGAGDARGCAGFSRWKLFHLVQLA